MQAALALETDALEEFRAQAHLHLAEANLPENRSTTSLLDWWAVMQHHHAPTRLLDWTQSPYVAAYFAVETDPDKDGVIFIVDGNAAVEHFQHTRGSNHEVKNMELRSTSVLPLVSLWRPSKRTERFVAQQGYFSFALNVLHAHDDAFTNALTQPGAGADDGPLRRWIFPAQLKPEIIRQLRVMNIAPHSLFPGLDGLGRSVADLVRFGPFKIPGTR